MPADSSLCRLIQIAKSRLQYQGLICIDLLLRAAGLLTLTSIFPHREGNNDKESILILNYKRTFVGALLFVFAVIMTGCSDQGGFASNLPEKGPEVVASQFYNYISEAKIKGGASPAKEAFKLIDSETAHMNVHQFLEIIKSYPPGFMVEVGSVKINGTQAVVDITYKMPSSFGGSYDVKGAVPLNLDEASSSWVIDFTGDTYGMNKSEFMAMTPETSK